MSPPGLDRVAAQAISCRVLPAPLGTVLYLRVGVALVHHLTDLAGTRAVPRVVRPAPRSTA